MAPGSFLQIFRISAFWIIGTTVKLPTGIWSFSCSPQNQSSSAPGTDFILLEFSLYVCDVPFFYGTVLLGQRKQDLINSFDLLLIKRIGILFPRLPYHTGQSISIADKQIRIINYNVFQFTAL